MHCTILERDVHLNQPLRHKRPPSHLCGPLHAMSRISTLEILALILQDEKTLKRVYGPSTLFWDCNGICYMAPTSCFIWPLRMWSCAPNQSQGIPQDDDLICTPAPVSSPSPPLRIPLERHGDSPKMQSSEMQKRTTVEARQLEYHRPMVPQNKRKEGTHSNFLESTVDLLVLRESAGSN